MKATQSSSNVLPNTQTTNKLERPYRVQVLFHGLLIGAFKKENGVSFFEVGVLHPSPKEPHIHQLKLEVWDRDDYAAAKHRITCDNPDDVMELEVTGGGGIRAYRRNRDFNHDEDNDNRYDARWLADFESASDFYADKCEKYPKKLRHRFRFYDGVVYSLLRSVDLQKETRVGDKRLTLGRITQVLAIGLNGKNLRLANSNGELLALNDEDNYNIVVSNGCVIPNKPEPNKDSDFNYLFDAFSPPTPIKVYTHEERTPEKMIAQMNAEVSGIRNSELPEQQLAGLWEIFGPGLSRYDPCGMGFFGQSNGLDDSPNGLSLNAIMP